MSRILVVDDDEKLSGALHQKLTAEGHEVTAIHTGNGAFELAKKVKPEIALVDIMLPGTTGYQLCRRLRIDPELYPMSILILTAITEEPEVIHGIEQGADDYIEKPFKIDGLMDKLDSLGKLNESVAQRNPTTNLPGTQAIKREINHRLARKDSVAVCYIDAVNYKPFCAIRRREGRHKALVFMAKLLSTITRSVGIYESYVCHMGGEHFAVLLNYEDCERFTGNLITSFDQNIRSLYHPEEIEQGYIAYQSRSGGEKRYPLMALSIGVVHNQFREFTTANQMFDVLQQIRPMAEPKGISTVFVDRRKHDR